MTDQTGKVKTFSNVLAQDAQNGTFDTYLLYTKIKMYKVNNTLSFLFLKLFAYYVSFFLIDLFILM